PSSFSVVESFEVDPDGSIPRSSIRTIKSSGIKEVDTAALQVPWMFGESHLLGILSGLPSNSLEIKLEIKVADNISHLTIASLAATPEQARAKSEQFRLLTGFLRLAQRSKNPAVAELLSNIAVKSDDKQITADLAVPCSRATEMLRMLNNK